MNTCSSCQYSESNSKNQLICTHNNHDTIWLSVTSDCEDYTYSPGSMDEEPVQGLSFD